MANQLLTIGMITKEALRLFRNQNALLRMVDTQYDDQFARSGAKIGATLNIRLPTDFVVGSGPTVVPQSTVQTQTSLTVSNQSNVAMSFSSADLALSLDRFSDLIIKPAVNVLAGAVAANLMSAFDGGTGQGPSEFFVHAVDGNNNTITPTASTWLQAGALLDQNSAPRTRRIALLDPQTQARTVSGLAGFYNPQVRISEQTETGLMQKQMLGLDWYYDQTILKHATGTFTGATVNGANQTGNVLTVSGLTGTLNSGDVITVAGVVGVNRVTKFTNGTPKQFVVTAPVPSGATSIPIYPAIVPAGAGGAQAQYQTVVASPANGAAITLGNVAGEIYRKNLVMLPEAITLATADLELPRGVHDAHRESYDGVSLRIIGDYVVLTDQFVWRMDVLYGYALLRPEWVVAVGDAV